MKAMRAASAAEWTAMQEYWRESKAARTRKGFKNLPPRPAYYPAGWRQWKATRDLLRWERT
ncbi:MAG TPA: hypothetical protein VGS80_11325 [Ktedonobacterales bacterium]|nr:hypothetical protein [Ktedonobacterales bacterium]